MCMSLKHTELLLTEPNDVMPHGKMSPEPNFSPAYALSCPDGIRDGVLSSVTPSFDSLTCSLHLQRNSQAPLSPTELCLFAFSPSQSHCHLIPVEDFTDLTS